MKKFLSVKLFAHSTQFFIKTAVSDPFLFDDETLIEQQARTMSTVIQRQLLPVTSATSVHTDGIPTLSFRAMRSGTESFAGSQGSFRQDLSTVVNETANAIVEQNETWNHDHDKQSIHDAMSRAHLVTGGDAHLSPLLLKIGVFVLVAERLAQVWIASLAMFWKFKLDSFVRFTPTRDWHSRY